MNNIRKYIFPFAVICMLLLLMCGCKKKETYTVTFDANGGTGTMQPQIFVEDEPQALRLNEFTCDNYTFSYWSPLKQHVFSIPEDPKHEYRNGDTITVSANMTLYAHWENITRGQSNGHDWVDLGLPSGTKWATCNVGADTPEGYGDYFAWGETTTKESYVRGTYTYYDEAGLHLNKYNGQDSITILESTDDAATANWGASWRMPTAEEFDELQNNCTVIWTNQNGINGNLFVGSNGNSIFMPSADCSYTGISGYGYYWSSSLYTHIISEAICLRFNSEYCYLDHIYRCYGLSVRPVLIENN